MEGVCPADARPRRSECSHVAFHDDSREADAWNLETPDRDVRFTRWGDSIPAAIDREVVAGSTESSCTSVIPRGAQSSATAYCRVSRTSTSHDTDTAHSRPTN